MKVSLQMKARTEHIGLILVFGILFFAGCASNEPAVTTTTEPEIVTTTEPVTTTTTTSTTTTTTTTTTTSTTTTIPAVTHYVNITEKVFMPVDLKINKGDTVVWTNNDRSPHTITSEFGGELASEPIERGDNFTHTFNATGNFAYHCKFNGAKMNARIVVVETVVPSKTTTTAATSTTKRRPEAY
jgi:plastocyanin